MHPATTASHLPAFGGDLPRASDAWHPTFATAVLVAVVLGSVPLAIVAVLDARLPALASAPISLLLHESAEVFGVMVYLSIFGVGWFTHGFSRDRHTLFLACALLGAGLMTFLHTMSFPGMPAFFGPSTPVASTQYGLAARLFIAIALLASVFVPPDATTRWISRRVLLPPVLAVSGLVVVGVLLLPERVPAVLGAGGVPTRFALACQLAVVLLLALAVLGYAWRSRRLGDVFSGQYAAALVLSAFAEVAFVASRGPLDALGWLGHAYQLAALIVLYRALLVRAVQFPYLGFEAERRALGAEIQERRSTEAALRHSEESLRAAQRTARLGIWDLDLAHQRVEWSAETYALFELDPTRSPASWSDMYDVVHPDDRDAVRDAYWRSIEEHTPYDVVHRVVTKDGRPRYARERCETTYDAAGKPLRSLGTVQDVTEHYEAVERARSAALYARSLIEASLDPLVTISPDGKVTDVNRATEEVTGLGRDRLVGTDFADYFTEPALARTGYRRVLELGTVRDYPLTIRHVSGRTVDVLYNATVYRDEAGALRGVFAAARDVTERREAERRARAASLYARSLIEASLDPLVTISPDGKVTDVNRATEEVTGLGRDRLVGTDFADYFTEPALARTGYRRVLEQGTVRDYPLTIRHASGRTVDVLYHATVYRDETGRIQGVFAAARDITERKRAEVMRAHLAAIIEHSSDAVIGKDLGGVVRSWNLGAERIYGYTAAEMIGRSINVLSPPGLEEETLALIDRIRRGEEVVRHESVRARKDGQRIDVSLTLSPIRDASGTTVGVSTIARDITERRRTEQQLARLAAELERRVAERTGQLAAANRELEAFAYSVSHDLRAPLRHISGFVALLQQRAQASFDDQARHYAAVISDAAGAMGRMIDDLLAFSRMGRADMAQSRVDVRALARECIEELGPEAEGRVVDWKLGEIPEVLGDRQMLRLALGNLVSNALKFTRTRARAEIEIGSAPSGQGGETVVFVRDNGVGFEMRYADKLFKVFQRLHRAEDFEGTGIGLANVRRIVERHGGRVWAESAPDQGATFFLSLPSAPPAEAP